MSRSVPVSEESEEGADSMWKGMSYERAWLVFWVTVAV